MELSQLFSKELHARIAWLGRFNWLRLNPGSDNFVSIYVDWPKKDNLISDKDYSDLGIMKKALSVVPVNVINLYTFSKILNDGFKVFSPTIEQCEAMENVDVNIKFEEYTQPYPVICYEYPEAFMKRLAEKFNTKKYFLFSTCHHFNNNIITDSVFPDKSSIQGMLAYRAWTGRTIEDALLVGPNGLRGDESDNDFKLATYVQRLAINFSLLMSNAPTIKRWARPKDRQKHEEMAKSKNLERRARGKQLMLSDREIIEFDQKVEFFGTESEHSNGSVILTGRNLKSHWRRGHWRNQAYGTGFQMHRNIFIKPVLVRKDIFVGQTSDTVVKYIGKNP